MSSEPIIVVGAGLAGSEAAWQIAQQGVPVRLYEMRPDVQTPAHKTGLFAELVCSNSLKSDSPETAHGLLKAELRRLGSLILKCADEAKVPAGSALAVDRDVFAQKVTDAIEGHPLVEIVRAEMQALPTERPAIIATGPLTSSAMAKALFGLTDEKYLFFYDAISPIVAADSIDRDLVFMQSRYGKGEDDYINCPMDQAQYEAFYEALIGSEISLHADVDPKELFDGCLPVEVIGKRGRDALRFGPMKPVGLRDPKTDRAPYAVVQLRPENNELTMYNLVGFQTSLKWGEQARVFRMIPGLEHCEFLRYGAIHRNTFINAPTLLQPTFQARADAGLFFAGQLTGVEGYMESTGAGLLAGLNVVRLTRGEELLVPPRETMLGALAHHITTADPESFQPMNANYGILPPLENEHRIHRNDRKPARSKRALKALEEWLAGVGIA
ncbi:methylenetetrahydrofolate--tRNA-(uracil(54)-C(5))-methyltransferase (FADH(2)-oxidizing) TrmFO [bacterium]|nr:methylenetetrahydrofolate--tRNA-(uracil(54)-C(5))-methyltransferase (FADH(2)-oxidizing) TrmFO [bacterium]